MKHWFIGSGIVVLGSTIAGGVEGALLPEPVGILLAFGTGVLMQTIYIAVTWKHLIKSVGEL